MIKRDLYYDRIPTKSLRDDVRYLGNILGRVIKKQEGSEFFNLVEKIRLLSKANSANKNHKDPFKKIILQIKNLTPKKVFKLKKIPFRSFEIKKRNEETIGELFTFFMLETILLGKLMKINPFNQPAVELIKKETKKILI